MTKEEIKAFIELKQADMPFEVKDRAEALPLDGRDIFTIPGVRRCGKSYLLFTIFRNYLLETGVPEIVAHGNRGQCVAVAWRCAE